MFQIGQKWYGLNVSKLGKDAWLHKDTTDLEFLCILEVESIDEGDAICKPIKHNSGKMALKGFTIKQMEANSYVAFDFAYSSGLYFPVFSSLEKLEDNCYFRENINSALKLIKDMKDGAKLKKIINMVNYE